MIINGFGETTENVLESVKSISVSGVVVQKQLQYLWTEQISKTFWI